MTPRNFLSKIYHFLLVGYSVLLTGLNFKFINMIPKVKKFFIATQIVFYIIKYYLGKNYNYIIFYFQRDFIWFELKSIIPIILTSFFIYYFIIIELSIMLFGYSLLCYRFTFVMLAYFLIVSWRLEAEFIKDEIKFNLQSKIQPWVEFYGGQNPLSLYDYLTFYRRRPLFWLLVINWRENDIFEGRLNLGVFYFFLFFFFIYSCSYRFEPWFVTFIARYFHPVVNFFETRKNPRLEDFSSALIWFRNWLFAYFEAKNIKSEQLTFIKKLTRPSSRLESWANVQRGFKISLRKHGSFSDVFFLWMVWQYPAISQLVFSLEQPIITATRMDPNWKLLFLRYITDQYNTTNKNFWKENFYNNRAFWNLLIDFKVTVNETTTKIEQSASKYYQQKLKFSRTPFEMLLEQNYLENSTQNPNPFYERYGTNRDFYFNLIRHSKIPKVPVMDDFKEIFSSSAYYTPGFTITGLLRYQTDNKNKATPINVILNEKVKFISLLTKKIQSKEIDDLYQALKFNLDINLWEYATSEIFSKPSASTLKLLLSRPLNNWWFYLIYIKYNTRLGALEQAVQAPDLIIPYRRGRYVTLGFLSDIMHKWLDQLENIIYNWDFFTFMQTQSPTMEDAKYIYTRFLNPMIYVWRFKRKMLRDMGYKKEHIKLLEAHLHRPYFVKFTAEELTSFIEAEQRLQRLERMFGLRPPAVTFQSKTNYNFFSREQSPWYIKTLQYFATRDYRSVLPGFVRYFYPTPFPTVFSTFGFNWNKYQFYRKNTMSTIVGYSDSLAEMWNSTPLALYSGVEAILYIKPVLDIFDFVIKLFIKVLTYPIEFLITQEVTTIFNSIFSLAFFAHFIWFIHFYIYTFIFFYLLYYFFIYYYQKVGFKWFYERTFEEIMLSGYNNWIFWHSLSDLWKNYRSPEQLLILNVHTNLLMHYSFPYYTNYFVMQNKKIDHFIITLVNFLNNYKSLKNFTFFLNIYNNDKKKLNKLVDQDYFLFRSFFNITLLKFTPLLFLGGTDINSEQLIWSYFDYLNQISHFLSRCLRLNYFEISWEQKFQSLLKQFTIFLSSIAPAKNFLFLEQPLVDTVISWKLILKLIFFFKNSTTSNFDLFYSITNLTVENKTPLVYTSFINYKRELYNYFTNSGQDIYKQFETNFFPTLTKLGSNAFWDDKRYWVLAFFRSFRFIPKFTFPNSDIHLSYQATQSHLARIAYANSWLCQSTYIRPFYNIVQHLWWTSRLYARANSLLVTPFNLSQPGISILDHTWNFHEKRYSFQFSSKVETVFGFVKSLDLTPNYFSTIHGVIPYENKNFDLSFFDTTFKHKTTNRSYLKNNPPLNLLELNISPYDLFSLFKNYPSTHWTLYLSFLYQFNFIHKNFNYKDWDLDLDFKKLDIFSGSLNKTDDVLYAKYDFYLKKFDFLLKFSKENIFQNYIFGFDVSYFFSHFTTYDNFIQSLDQERPNFVHNDIEAKFNTETLTNLFANRDVLADLDNFETWFEKPFGVLDKLEMHSMRKYKFVKQLDTKSFTRNWDDAFLNLDVEHTQSEVGFASYPKEEKKNLLEAYNENILNFWKKWFPYNPTIVRNSNNLILIGWVGELYEDTLTATNLLFSLQYASPAVSLSAWKTSNHLSEKWILLNNAMRNISTFFAKSESQLQLFAKAFSWLNLILHPVNHWYSLGPKAAAWLDYWSWKCGLTLDYQNGFYSYWPYLGFRHSFSSWLTTYDPLYGFYKSYRQLNDNPLLVDPSTGAVQRFQESDDLDFFEQNPESRRPGSRPPTGANYDPALNREFALPYREIYYSFQHPYFIGYLYFWLLVYSTNTMYLGLVNFSSKRYLLRQFFVRNALVSVDFTPEIFYWNNLENRFRKQMFNYRRYYINPIKLISFTDCIVDDELLQPVDNFNSMFKFYLIHDFLFTYLVHYLKFNSAEIIYLLDFRKITKQLININWLTLDLPFTLNPYLLVNYDNMYLNVTDNIPLFYKLNSFSFSKFNTLKESINFNLFYDWASGTYLDTINFVSYFSTSWGSGILNSIFFDNPSYVAATFVRSGSDKSNEIAKTFQYQRSNFLYHDILISHDYALHNFSLVVFFRDSLNFMISFESSFKKKHSILNFLNFYIRSSFLDDFLSSNAAYLPDLNSKLIVHTGSKFSKIKKLIFIYKLQQKLSYEILLSFFVTGLIFTNHKWIDFFFKTIWFRLTMRYMSLRNYYQEIGKFITIYFLNKSKN